MTLQSRLQPDGGPSPAPKPPALADPVAYLRHLVSGGRFHRDSGFGRIYHLGSISLRENAPTDSLHVVVHGDHISAHVDRVSPLDAGPAERTRYSVTRAAAHNVVGAAQDAVRLLRGRKGDHRSHLDCEWQWDRRDAADEEAGLLEPFSWSVHLEATVAGALDAARMGKAVDTVFGHRPYVQEPFDVVDCPDDDALDAARRRLLAERVALGEWPPVRVVLVHRPAGDAVLFNVNHAAADGFGAVRVLRAIAGAYAGEAVAPLDFLGANDLPVRPASAPVSAVEAWYRTTVERVRDLLANPARIAPDGALDEPGYGFHLVRLSVADTRRVANVHRQGTARNVLLAGLHLAIGEWNLDHGTPGRRIGVLVPVDLRPPEWEHESVANLSVTARVSTSRRHRSDARAALKAITAQKTRNKRFRTGVALIEALDRNGLLPLWAKQSLVVLQPLTRNREVDTALLANAGWLAEAPSFGTEAGETTDVWFSSPARAPMTLCIGAVVAGGQLQLTFRYPRRLFDAGAAARFAGSYVDHILGVAERRW